MAITGRDYRVNKAYHEVDIMLHETTCASYQQFGTGRYWLRQVFRSVEQAESNFPGYRVRTHPACLRGQGEHLDHSRG